MKGRWIFFLLFLLVLALSSSFLVIRSLAFFNIRLSSPSNSFTTGEWKPGQTSFVLKQNGVSYSDLENVVSYTDQAGDHYTVTIDDTVGQFLSFEYNLTSQETAEYFDDPALLLKINGTVYLQVSNLNHDNGYQTAYLDLSKLGLNSGVYDLEFSLQNTFDDLFRPSLELREVTTTKLFAVPGSVLEFRVSKPVASVFVEYSLIENNQASLIQEELVISNSDSSYSFTVPSNFYGSELAFWSLDLFDNLEARNYVVFQLDQSLGVTNFDYQVFLESDNELSVQTSYLNQLSQAKFFQARVSTDLLETPEDWQAATPLELKEHQQFSSDQVAMIAPQTKVVNNNLVFSGLDSNLSYLSIKLCNLLDVCVDFVKNYQLEL